MTKCTEYIPKTLYVFLQQRRHVIMVESSLDAVEDNVRASGVVYREERRTEWLKEAAGTARFTPPRRWKYAAQLRCEVRGTHSRDDRHRSLRGYRLRLSCREADNTSPPACGFLSFLFLYLSISLSRITRGARWEASRADDYASPSFTRRVKKVSTLPIARRRLTRFF